MHWLKCYVRLCVCFFLYHTDSKSKAGASIATSATFASKLGPSSFQLFPGALSRVASRRSRSWAKCSRYTTSFRTPRVSAAPRVISKTNITERWRKEESPPIASLSFLSPTEVISLTQKIVNPCDDLPGPRREFCLATPRLSTFLWHNSLILDKLSFLPFGAGAL